MKKKNYLLQAKTDDGAVLTIVANADNLKPFFVYYCGSDSGAHYSRIGDAARHIAAIVSAWESRGFRVVKRYGGVSSVPVHGDAWNVAVFRWQCFGHTLPRYNG